MNTSEIKYRTGIDVGSTTLKAIVLDQTGKIAYKAYRRHKADINNVFEDELNNIRQALGIGDELHIAITGSAGMGIAERTGIPFVQEVVAAIEVVRTQYPDTHTLIDLGGEDAKMVFFEDGKQPDIRMNGSCAGGTGAFIDQMADLMHIPIEELGEQALAYEKLYPVASRCGVFAKTDVQNLIARNVRVPDVAMSILQTVALQSITSLARGRDIKPKVLCIGGPLTFIPALRNSCRELLKMDEAELFSPENSEFFPAWGTALKSPPAPQRGESLTDKKLTVSSLDASAAPPFGGRGGLNALFKDEEEYSQWKANRKIKPLKVKRMENREWKMENCLTDDCHSPFSVLHSPLKLYLGIDSGSTTTKILIMDQDENIVYTFYAPNMGNPLNKVIQGMQQFYDEAKAAGVSFSFAASAATGYGEDLIKSALGLDYGIVETMAHLSGAQYVDPDVSFVLDIGGQDMKSIFTRRGIITNIELNEACSSGCGSFLQNFASTMNLTLPEFTQAACLAGEPCDLGSRCTVFMNSKVKQSLRENASLGDIAAGLAYSVVKNCLFKVLKISNLNQLGDHIVVQGGTFKNNAVFRALELLSGKTVSSTDYPELMGALGAALYARKMSSGASHRCEVGTSHECEVGASRENLTALPRHCGLDPQSPEKDKELRLDVRYKTKEIQCNACSNRCAVIRFEFENGNVCYAGNKCEKVFYNKNSAPQKGYNAFELKNKILFDRQPQPPRPPKGGEPDGREPDGRELDGQLQLPPLADGGAGVCIGIPRVLNMFENYPFWHTLLTECGFQVILSPESTFPLYQKGVGSIMSENICFPAKLVHGHILTLIENCKLQTSPPAPQRGESLTATGFDASATPPFGGRGGFRIFYPIVPKDQKEFSHATNSYNCPVVSGYPEVIKSAIDPLEKYGISLDMPVITFSSDKALKRACAAYLSSLGVDKKTFKKAFEKASTERQATKDQLKNRQRELLDEIVKIGLPAFVVAGRPYHADPLIHQKVGQILSDLGAHVFTDDVFRTEESEGFRDLNLVSQWSYPNRVVQAALEVARLPQNVQLIQLNSFGCGPDSFFMDEIGSVLRQAGKNHTVLRIDEIASPGSIRLRLRSLIESQRVAHSRGAIYRAQEAYQGYNIPYTKQDRQKTILIPWFADFISPFIPVIGELAGYKVVNVPKTSKESVEIGLKYGHNEVCYPSTLVLGDLISALQSGNYDLNDVVVAITQTGGQCRATNYLAQIKSGLHNAGFSHIPVVVVATGEVFQNEQSAFTFPIRKLAGIVVNTLLYGDALQQMYSSSVVREQTKGEAQRTFNLYVQRGIEAIRAKDSKRLLKHLEQAVEDFNSIAVFDRQYTKVGLIGEIYIKYNAHGQAYITQWLREQNMEVVTPPILDFFAQYFVNSKVDIKNGIKKNSMMEHYLSPLLWRYLNRKTRRIERIMKQYRFYHPSESVYVKAEYASEILDLSHQFGEGWLIAAEIACYARDGINKVVCIQPFGCIANHIVAKGIEKRIKKFYPDVNLLYLDIDGGIADVNLQNRLHFLIH